jgi:hypothetical protein
MVQLLNMKKYFFLLFVISSPAIFSVDLPAKASKEDPQKNSVEPGYHEHDGGYFRLLTGFGHGYFFSNQGANSFEISRSIFKMWDMQLGYSIMKNIIVFAGFGVAVLPSPLGPIPLDSPLYQLQNSCNLQIVNDCTVNDKKPPSDGGFAGFPIGASYYFMPENIYLSISFEFPVGGIYKLSLRNGFCLQASLGKEWWVSKNWGLGLALNIEYDFFPTNYPDDPIITPLHAFMIGLSFSATYN